MGPNIYRHVKSGGIYTLFGFGKMQASDWVTQFGLDGSVRVDMREVAIYQGKDFKLWVRPREEFEDGRFVPHIPT